MVEKVATIIDNEIYRNYSFFPWNYLAYDMMSGERRYTEEYTREDVEAFDTYLNGQVSKIDIPNRDDAFLREKMVMMYGNVVRNKLLIP